MNLKELVIKDNFIYIVYLKEHKENKYYKTKFKKYIEYIQKNMNSKKDLKLFQYEDLSEEEKLILENKNVFPLLVIKEFNKESIYITGIRKEIQ